METIYNTIRNVDKETIGLAIMCVAVIAVCIFAGYMLLDAFKDFAIATGQEVGASDACLALGYPDYDITGFAGSDNRVIFCKNVEGAWPLHELQAQVPQ